MLLRARSHPRTEHWARGVSGGSGDEFMSALTKSTISTKGDGLHGRRGAEASGRSSRLAIPKFTQRLREVWWAVGGVGCPRRRGVARLPPSCFTS